MDCDNVALNTPSFSTQRLLPLFMLYGLSCYGMAAQPQQNTAQKQSPSPTVEHQSSISSNPAAVNVGTGSGTLQRYLEKKLDIHDNHGITVQGAWIGDTNRLFQGGIPQAEQNTLNSVGLLSLSLDTEKFNNWHGGIFNAQLLQENAQNTNAQAGVIQGYNSLPDTAPFNRTELYALWYRQALFNDTLFVRVGKTITTLDFNNVVKPVSLSRDNPNIPAVTSLIYTPIFISPAVDGLMPGYTNTAYGVTLSYTPTQSWYASYGIYDGNLANGTQTGLTGPTLNGNYFQIAESGLAWLLGSDQKPGTVGLGVWQQKGPIKQANLLAYNAAGMYLFGSQRLWYRHPGKDTSGISGFYQYGINNSQVLPMKQSLGAGLTAFGLMPHRPQDSFGTGWSLAWLNQHITNRKTEFMLQVYYQASLFSFLYLEPAISYIPTPGQSEQLKPVTAGTLRAIALF